MKRIFEFTLAGHTWYLSFVYPETVLYFAHFLKRSNTRETTLGSTPALIEAGRAVLPQDSPDSYVESRTLIDITAKSLLQFDACIFHAVSFLWRGRAWLLTAPSGTGKTTQYLNWQRLFPGEITMICGDMPVLERVSDDAIMVYPSPWNGKENMGGKEPAPLAGIVFLEQGSENIMSPLAVRDALMPFFAQFIVRPDTEDQIKALARLMDQMVRKVPCWKLVNRGDDASTELLRETLFDCLLRSAGGEDGNL